MRPSFVAALALGCALSACLIAPAAAGHGVVYTDAEVKQCLGLIGKGPMPVTDFC